VKDFMARHDQSRSARTGERFFQGGVAAGIVLAGLFMLRVLSPSVLYAQVNATFGITSISPPVVGAGANGATLTIGGTLPTAATQAQSPVQVCFYTGYGSTAAITPSLPTTAGTETIVVPAATIQSIPSGNFTAANGYAVSASVYFVPQGTNCDGTFNAVLTSAYPETIGEPVVGLYSGPITVPQTNSATGLQAAPAKLVLNGGNFTAGTVVTFGSFGTLAPTTITPTALIVAVPAAFASSRVGTTAAVSVCNPGFCAGVPPITLTVAAPVPSVGIVTASPNPVSTIGTTTLTAQFKRDPNNGTQLPEPGAPSGVVTFTAGGNNVGTAPLVLDATAGFVPVSTAAQVAVTATPVINPVAGTYASGQAISITDSTPGALIYYTTNGTAPTISSNLYAGTFAITSTMTVSVIAVAAGYLASGVASNAYTIFVPIPTSLAFVQQPTSSATTVSIAPPVTVAIQDQNGVTVANSTAAVTVGIQTNPGNASLAGTTTVNAVNGIATFSNLSIAPIANGYTLSAVSGSLPSVTSAAFNITPYPITVQLFNPLIGVTSTLPGTFTLTNPAPQGGVTVNLVSNATNFVTVSPASVNVAAGATTGTFTYTGIAPGLATITASATNYLAGSASVTATNSLVSLGTIPPVAPGQSVSLALSIATNAPAGGVTINFTTSNPNVATVTSSVFIPQGQRTAAANPQIVGVTIGTTTITATAQGYAPDTRAVNVTVTSSFSPTSIVLNLATSSTTTLNISAPAQVGGLTFTLSSDFPNIATVPASVTIPQGQTSVPIPITGVAQGNTIIRADSPGVIEAVLQVTVSSILSYSNPNPVTGVNLQVGENAYLPSTSPTPITVTVTVADPTVAIISSSQTVVGTGTLTYPNTTSAGYLPGFYVQGQKAGTTTLTVTAQGYATATTTISVYPSGFTFGGIGPISTTTFSNPYAFNVYPTILNPQTLAFSTTATINPGVGPISVPVTISDPTIGTITTSPLVFNVGDTSKQTSLQPGNAGSATISVGTATGFSTSSNYTSFTATVVAPSLSLYSGNQITGVNMEVGNNVYLPVPPPNPITVTVTCNNGSIAAISSSGTVVGGTTLTFTNVTAAGYLPTFYVQGETTGTTTLTVTAPGYNNVTGTINVYPSGFTFAGNSGFSTTTFSAPTPVTVYATVLNPQTLTYYTTGQISPGVAPISVPVTSGTTSVGTVVTSPLIFNPGDSTKTTTFQPSSAGTSTISIGTPTGYSTSSNYTTLTATVTAPQLSFYNGNLLTGVKLQQQNNVYLPVAPPNPVTVTVTCNGPGIALISNSGTVVGGTTLTFTNVTTAGYLPAFYVQGVTTGTTTLTVTASGYTSATATINVYPSGFTFAGGGAIGTTTFSGPTAINVYASILNPGTLTYSSLAPLSPGVGPVSVGLTSSNTVVGTISTSPLTFNTGDQTMSSSFQPTSAGTSTISIVQPQGFSTPASYTSFTATVTAPALSFYGTTQTTGSHLEVQNNGYLPVAPPNPVTVTITSNGPSIATLSTNATTVGTTTLTFTNVTASGYLPPFFVQGQSVGSTTLTISAPGYTNGTATITVNPSGFTFAGAYNSGLPATAGAAPTQLSVYPSILTPGTLAYAGVAQLNPGLGGTNVVVTSSNTAVGTITTSPVVFNGGEPNTYLPTGFKPVAAGTTNINITQPQGFTGSSLYTSIPATVQ
jgi:hypothetical protein